MRKVLFNLLLVHAESSTNRIKIIEAKLERLALFDYEVHCYGPAQANLENPKIKSFHWRFHDIFGLRSKEVFQRITAQINENAINLEPSFDLIITLTDVDCAKFVNFIVALGDELISKIFSQMENSTIALIDEEVTYDFFNQFKKFSFACLPREFKIIASSFSLIKSDRDKQNFNVAVLLGFLVNRMNLRLVNIPI